MNRTDCTATNDKLAIYLSSLRGGGAQRVMVTLANAFSERGYRVDLVVAVAEGPYRTEISQNVSMIDLKACRVGRSLPALVAYLRRERPVGILTALTHANVIVLMAKLLARTPTSVVVSERNTLTPEALREGAISAAIVYSLTRWLYPLAKGIVAVSDGSAEAVSEHLGIPREKITRIYNPVDAPRIQQRASEDLEHPWFRVGQPPVVLGVGRLTRQKDFATLIKAFKQLLAERPVRLMILGEGELRNELQEQAKSLGLGDNHFCLSGFVENPFKYLSRSSAFVLSSRWEGLPNVMIQALACGCPVVATDCPSGPMEILEGGKWGRLVPVGDADALANAIAQTLDQVRHPDLIGRALDFSVERAVDSYLKVLLRKS